MKKILKEIIHAIIINIVRTYLKEKKSLIYLFFLICMYKRLRYIVTKKGPNYSFRNGNVFLDVLRSVNKQRKTFGIRVKYFTEST